MESDLSLIKRIQDSRDDESLTELISRHSGIYVYIVDQYSRNERIRMNKKSILDEKDYMIYKSALDYDPGRNSKFSTFLANQTKWKCQKKKIKG